jgi:hypothetical protein
MPERPPPSAASLTWRLSEAAPLEAMSADVLLRQRLATLSAIGFLLGYYAMHNQWFQVGWVGCFTLAWFVAGGFQDFIDGLRLDRWLFTVAALVLLMLARSSVLDSPGLTMKAMWQGWFGSGLLLLVLMTLWSVARQPRAPTWLGVPLVSVAVLTALGSMIVFYCLDERAVFGRSLLNWFIYGGWNSVCTGMTFGFAAMWASLSWQRETRRQERLLWLGATLVLIFATLLTASRGALLALIISHAVWYFILGWRRALKPVLLLLGCALLFQASSPLIISQAKKDFSRQLGIAEAEITTSMLVEGGVSTNPAARAIERADNGRFAIYSAGVNSMTTWKEWLFGKGLWSDNDSWSCSLWWYPEHLHSIFMDALVRGGILGLGGLVVIVGWGLCRAWQLVRQGEELWFVLACFGITGLLFDGDSAFSMLTLPRFETLLLWVPLVIASARDLAANRFAKPAITR